MAQRRNRPLILASASPRRRSLLKEAGIRIRVIPSRIRERHPRQLPPRQLVKNLALQKARAVSQRHPSDVVLGADTVVYINGHVIGKPKDERHAVRILRELSGSWQRVYSGVAVVWGGGRHQRTAYAVSHVKLRRLTEADIKKACRRHMDKAGAYAVQQKDDPFVEKIRGDFDTVVGLPVRVVKKLLSAL